MLSWATDDKKHRPRKGVRVVPRKLVSLLLLLALGSVGGSLTAQESAQAPSRRGPARPPPSLTISGNVLSENGMRAISGAKVELLTALGLPMRQTFTDSQGLFEFRNVEAQSYAIEVSEEGFEAARQTADLSLFVGSRFRLRFVLSPARRAPVLRSELPGTISAEELQIPEEARKAFAKGLIELNEKNRPEQSVGHFQEAIALYPSYNEAYVQLSLAQVEQGQFAAAQETLEKAVAVDAKNPRAYLFLGILLGQEREVNKAQQALREAAKLDGENWLARFELAKALLRTNKVNEAYEHAQRARALNPQAPTIYFLLSSLRIRRREYGAALAELEKVIELHPDSSWAEQASQQHQTLELLVKLGEQSSDINTRWKQVMDTGRQAHQKSNFAQAESLLKVALEDTEQFGPDDARRAATLSLLGDVYVGWAEYHRAEPLYQGSLAILERSLGPEHPFTAITLNNLAQLYHLQGHHRRAEPLYERSLAILGKTLGREHPHVATCLENYAALLRETGRSQEADKLERRATAIRDKHPQLKPQRRE